LLHPDKKPRLGQLLRKPIAGLPFQVVNDKEVHINILNHLMYDLPRMDGAAWGANLPGAPIYFQQLNPAPITEFYVVMGNWSDETPVNGDSNSASGSNKH